MRSWYAIRARDEGAEVVIYDEIGAYGITAKRFLAELAALPNDAPLTVRLNSPGGSVFDAVAIHKTRSPAMPAASPSGSTASPPRLPPTSRWRAPRSSCRRTPSS